MIGLILRRGSLDVVQLLVFRLFKAQDSRKFNHTNPGRWIFPLFFFIMNISVTLINMSWEQKESLFTLEHSLMRGRSTNRDRQRRRHQMLIACFEGQAQQEENNNGEFPFRCNKSMNNDSDAQIWRVLLPWWTGNFSLISSLRFVSSFVVFLLLRCLTILWTIEESTTRANRSWNTTVHKECCWGYLIFSKSPVNVLAANCFTWNLIHDSFHYGMGIIRLFARDSYFEKSLIDLDLHFNIPWLHLIWIKS